MQKLRQANFTLPHPPHSVSIYSFWWLESLGKTQKQFCLGDCSCVMLLDELEEKSFRIHSSQFVQASTCLVYGQKQDPFTSMGAVPWTSMRISLFLIWGKVQKKKLDAFHKKMIVSSFFFLSSFDLRKNGTNLDGSQTNSYFLSSNFWKRELYMKGCLLKPNSMRSPPPPAR